MEIGFGGLGRMGGHMARHLASAGHNLRVYDVSPDAVHRFDGVANVTPAANWADLAAGAEIVFTSLPGPKDIEHVVLSPGGLRDSMAPGAVYIDVSTNSPLDGAQPGAGAGREGHRHARRAG
jgi:3-hydroxyisobutyrate dehydrogenase-like beta-hydroxyacid dehydrogenase